MTQRAAGPENQSLNLRSTPPMRVRLGDNESLRSVLAAYKVRQLIARKGKGL